MGTALCHLSLIAAILTGTSFVQLGQLQAETGSIHIAQNGPQKQDKPRLDRGPSIDRFSRPASPERPQTTQDQVRGQEKGRELRKQGNRKILQF